MSNTFGNQIKITLFGESHGPKIGAVIDGLTPGIFVSQEKIKECLSLRRPSGSHETNRVENDEFEIIRVDNKKKELGRHIYGYLRPLV